MTSYPGERRHRQCCWLSIASIKVSHKCSSVGQICTALRHQVGRYEEWPDVGSLGDEKLKEGDTYRRHLVRGVRRRLWHLMSGRKVFGEVNRSLGDDSDDAGGLGEVSANVELIKCRCECAFDERRLRRKHFGRIASR
jgi:hypothetical protein